MTPGQTCSTCKAFSALTSECRRNAPTAIAIATGRPGELGVKGIYPPTPKDGWCSQWQSMEEHKSKSQWETT